MIKVLVLTDFSSGYSRSLLKGIVRYSQEVEGWTFYRMPLYYRVMHGDKGVVQWAKQWKADAIIAQLGDVNIGLLKNLNIPIIVQNYRDRIPGVCNLTGDYLGTGRLAAEFFINKGYCHFAYYGISDTVWSRERGAGYEERLARQQYGVHRLLEPSGANEQWAYNLETLGAWLKSLPKPVALFACDDYFALHISETCKFFGLSVPDEIAILGVDNDELLCNISNPPLSSIVLDVENGGYAAAKVLHELIEKKITRPTNITVGVVQILSRQSTQKYVIRDKYIMQVVEYIESHYTQPLSVPALQTLVPLSRRVFEKRFKLNTGVSIYQFIQRYRVERLSGELITSNRSIEELAVACGFEDAKNVARVFLKYKGMTPSEYRKRYHQIPPTENPKRENGKP